MSLYGLRLMQESYRQEEAARDAHNKKRAQERKKELTEEEITTKGEELYARVVKNVKEKYELGDKSVNVSCKFQPASVFNYVVKKLTEKGWKARYRFNDGEPSYDMIVVSPPKIDPTEGL